MKTAPFSVGAPRGAPVHEIGFTSILHISGGLKTTNAEKSTSQTAFGGQLPYKGSLGRPAVIFDHSLFSMMARRTAAANG